MPSGVYIRTEAQRKRIRELRKGCKGRPMSPENRAKINEKLKGRRMPPMSEETKVKISNSEKGKVVSEETKEKMRRAKGKTGRRVDPEISKAKKRFGNRRYAMRRKGADGTHTFDEWETLKAQYNWICPMCGLREPEIKLTEDHIIPLSKGGSDNIENIQPLCRSCNSKKGTKMMHLIPTVVQHVPEEKTLTEV